MALRSAGYHGLSATEGTKAAGDYPRARSKQIAKSGFFWPLFSAVSFLLGAPSLPLDPELYAPQSHPPCRLSSARPEPQVCRLKNGHSYTTCLEESCEAWPKKSVRKGFANYKVFLQTLLESLFQNTTNPSRSKLDTHTQLRAKKRPREDGQSVGYRSRMAGRESWLDVFYLGHLSKTTLLPLSSSVKWD